MYSHRTKKMQRLNGSPLQLWLEHYGFKKIVNALTVSSEHSASNGGGYDAVQQTVSTHNGRNSESLYANEVTSVSCVEPISEIGAPTELKIVSSTVSCNTCTTSSETPSGTQSININKIKLKQLSRLYDGDEHVDIRKSYCNKIKKMVHFLVSSVAFRIFGILLIFLDMCLVAIDLLIHDQDIYITLEYHSVSLAIALFFFVDVLLRVYVEGRQHYFSDLLNTLDAVIIGVTLVIAIVYIFYDTHFLGDIQRLAILFRPLRLLILARIFQLAHQKRHLEMLTRRLVSGNKRRYKKDGFDLDLTYVTERIIAMSFPSSGKQSFYRNPIKEVVRFLDTKHPNHYQVYNLCSERAYNPKHFHYRVRRVMIDDHNVPTLEEMLLFSKEVSEWLAQDPENVVAIHCKGGKGRTGTMVCACLIASEIVLNAKQSLYFFGERRTDKTSSSKFQGVETPSQNRYVEYFEKLKFSFQWTLPPRKILVIKRFIIYSIHGVGKGNGSDLKIQIIMWQETMFSCSSSQNCMMFHDIETDRVIINVFNCPDLYDDVKVKFLSLNLPKYYDDCSFFFWFHTAFIQNNRLYLSRNELDNPHKSKTWKIYGPKFAVEVYFGEK